MPVRTLMQGPGHGKRSESRSRQSSDGEPETSRASLAVGNPTHHRTGTSMWTLIKGLLVKAALLKWLLKTLGSLGILVPIAFVLKLVGLPVLMVLGVLALPILIMLALFGMPFILVFLLGGALLAILSAALSFGLLALKIIVPIVLLVWLLRWVMGWNGSKPDGGTTSTTPPPATGPVSDV